MLLLDQLVEALLDGLAWGIKGLSSLVFFLAVTLLSLFFLLADGPKIRAWGERHMGVPCPRADAHPGALLRSLRGLLPGGHVGRRFQRVVVGVGRCCLVCHWRGRSRWSRSSAAYVPYLGALGSRERSVLVALGGAARRRDRDGGDPAARQRHPSAAWCSRSPWARHSAPSLAVLIVTIAGGALFGAVGLILAAPVTSAVRSHRGGPFRLRSGATRPAGADRSGADSAPLGNPIIIGAASVAAAVMLLVRRRAPEGSCFADGDRAAGVFGVIATGFSVLLGLIVFLAFESYDQSRTGAEAEARLVAQQFETAQFLPVAVRRDLGHELVCYSRFVVSDWPRLASASDDTVDTANPWAVALFRTLKATNPRSVIEQAAYDKWLDRTADREEARTDRIHGAVGVIPGPVGRPAVHHRGDLRLHAVLRRQRRARGHPGADDGLRYRRDRGNAAPDPISRRPLPRRYRRPEAGGDGADSAHPGH